MRTSSPFKPFPAVLTIAVLFWKSAVFGNDLDDAFARLQSTKELGVAMHELDTIAKFGEQAIPYLIRAKEITIHADNFHWHLYELLAADCAKYPDTFSTIILKSTEHETRFLAIHAVRESGQDKCDKALMTVFNDPKESQELRVQVMMCLVDPPDNAPPLSKDRLKAFLPGLQILLKERPREVDLRRAIDLSGYLGDNSSVPLLIPLLDDKNVHGSYKGPDGKWVQITISKTAHEALQMITNRRDVPEDRRAWEAVK